MPKEKLSERFIPKLYKRKYEDLGLYFFVEGQKSILPAISIEKAMYNYFKYIGNEDFNIESAMTIFMRMKKEFYECTKTNNGSDKS